MHQVSQSRAVCLIELQTAHFEALSSLATTGTTLQQANLLDCLLAVKFFVANHSDCHQIASSRAGRLAQPQVGARSLVDSSSIGRIGPHFCSLRHAPRPGQAKWWAENRNLLG